VYENNISSLSFNINRKGKHILHVVVLNLLKRSIKKLIYRYYSPYIIAWPATSFHFFKMFIFALRRPRCYSSFCLLGFLGRGLSARLALPRSVST
jgi:hypothetical protein